MDKVACSGWVSKPPNHKSNTIPLSHHVPQIPHKSLQWVVAICQMWQLNIESTFFLQCQRNHQPLMHLQKNCNSISCDILSQTLFHYITSLFIGWQAVLCSWQLLNIGTTYNVFIVFFKVKMLLVKWGISSDIIRKSRFTALLMWRWKTTFQTIYTTIYLPKWIFWIQVSPKYWIHFDSSLGKCGILTYS